MSVTIINIASYKFVHLDEGTLLDLRIKLKEYADQCDVKGTILLSNEGINLFLAGERENIVRLQTFIAGMEPFSDLVYKESISDRKPFTRMLVRLKKEIISMGHFDIKPEEHTAPHLSPEELKQWYDEGRDIVILDTRNDYEVQLGTFKDAIDLNIDTFRAFPDAIDMLPEEIKEKPVVTFCTGGIRCEKASELMLQKGFKDVYQLDGGILNYFEKCGSDHYEGECFVFDKRVAVDTNLDETKTKQCFSCRAPISALQQEVGGQCPDCGDSNYG